jgi:hypothetical protein
MVNYDEVSKKEEIMTSREDVEKRLVKIKNMKDVDKVASLLEIIVDLLLDFRFGEKSK